MDHPELPYPDLIIRTSSEMRMSNFLIWESAYSELWFCEKYWPDFSPADLAAAVEAYSSRNGATAARDEQRPAEAPPLLRGHSPRGRPDHLSAAAQPRRRRAGDTRFRRGLCRRALEVFQVQRLRGQPALFAALGLSAPLGAYLGGLLLPWLTVYGAFLGLSLALAFALTLAFVPFPFVSSEAIPEVLPDASARSLVAIYPGLFGAFIVLVATEPRYATESLLTFCVLVLSNDSLAWLVGMTLGKKRDIVAVSPNKSLAGFIGGVSRLSGTGLRRPRPSFPTRCAGHGGRLSRWDWSSAWRSSLGIFSRARSSAPPASRILAAAVPGRGGFLDTFDSLLFAAPAFYGLSLLLGYFR